MKKPIENTPTNNNAQDGEPVLLSADGKLTVSQILAEIQSEWDERKGDSSAQGQFIVSEFKALRRSLHRCGFLVHQIDELQLFKVFGCKSTTAFMWEKFKIKPPAVSRFRIGYTYALPISKALPTVKIDDLNEAQMRELRGVVARLNPELEGEKKVEKAVELYQELYQKNPTPTANDIAMLCPKPERKSKASKSGSGEPTQEAPAGQPLPVYKQEAAEDATADHEEFGSELEWKSTLETFEKVNTDDRIGSKLAAELSELLTYVVDHALIDPDIQERFVIAFEELGVEPLEDEDVLEGGFDE